MCLSSDGKLTAIFVCHRTVSMAAVYQLKIKYDQDKFGAVLWETKSAVSFPLEDKHAENEHRVIRKYLDATQKKCPHVVHFNVLRDWSETNSRHQKRSEGGKKIPWVSRSTGKSSRV